MSGIQMALMGAASSGVVNFVDQAIDATNPFATATATYQIKSDGYDYEIINSYSTTLTQWVTPTIFGGDYEVYATYTGDLGPGTFNSWVATSTNPSWGLVAGNYGVFKSKIITLQVRKVGTTDVLDTWTVTLNAEYI